MRAALSAGLWWAGLLVVAAQSPLSRLERVPLLGHEYVRLGDWAAANGFTAHWTSKRDLRITANSYALEFTIDARKAVIGNISVWLSAPIAAKNGSALITPLDLTTAVQPLLFPPRNSTGQKLTTICLDPGHGGKDPGNEEGRQQEKQYTLLLAKEVAARLTKAGFNVCLTRSTDRTLDLDERAETARRRAADLLLSLHYNAVAAGGVGVRGAEVYCMTPAHASSTNPRGYVPEKGAYSGNGCDARNMLLAYQVQKMLVTRLGLEDRGVRRARFQVLRDARMPAILIEAAFMSHPTDARKLIYDAAGRQRTAQAIVDGVLAYKQLVDPPSAPARTKAKKRAKT
jgi:N-acetylmuramoyl-L-alanine amidase